MFAGLIHHGQFPTSILYPAGALAHIYIPQPRGDLAVEAQTDWTY